MWIIGSMAWKSEDLDSYNIYFLHLPASLKSVLSSEFIK